MPKSMNIQDTKYGTYIDRCPGINAAGRKTKKIEGEGVSQCMRYITVDDIIQGIINAQPKEPRKFVVPPKNPIYKPNVVYNGFNTEVAQALIQPKKTFFEDLKDELKETAYKSYWLNELGVLPDQTANLPVGMNIYTTSFGKPSQKPNEPKNTVGGLINPKKCPHIVERDAMKGVDLYKISHKSYLPGEQIKHDPMMKFPPNLIFGKITPRSYNGKNVKTLLTWIDQNEVSTTSQSLAFFRYRHHHELGKSLRRIGIPKKYDECFTFGRKYINDVDQKNALRQLAEDVAFINQMKKFLRKNRFNFVHLVSAIKEIDKEETGFIDMDSFFEICQNHNLNFKRERVDPICKRLKIYTEDGSKVNYDKFCYLINPAEDMPNFGKVVDTPKETSYESAYMTMCKDLELKDEAGLESPAGLATNYLRKGFVALPPNMCRANIDDYPSETIVADLLNPSIFMQYGLNHRDFFQPRSREFMRDLWKEVGLEIPDEIFDLMWKEGERRDGIGNVSVETFRNMLDEISTGKMEQMAPLD